MDYYKAKLKQLVELSNIYKAAEDRRDVRYIKLIGNILLDMQHNLNKYVLTQDEKNKFYDLHKNDLYSISQLLRKHPKLKIQDVSKNKTIQVVSLIDTVFEPSIGYVTNTKKILEFISNIFKEFMKGITYFESNSNISHPIYHRDQSCGQRNELKDLDCTNVFDNSDEFMRRSQKSKMCHIERLVYNELFMAYFPSGEQDYKHKAMLLNTARGPDKFASCYPNTIIQISLDWTSDKCFPSRLNIYTVSPSKSKIEAYTKITKTYSKKYYNINSIGLLNVDVTNIYKPLVSCQKQIYDLETHIYIQSEKEQDFHKEQLLWNEIASHSI